MVGLESKLERSKSYLESTKSEQSEVCNVLGVFAKRDAFETEVASARTLAKRTESQHASLAGMGLFKPATLKENELGFNFIGSSPKSCIGLTFDIAASGGATCRAMIRPELYHAMNDRATKGPCEYLDYAAANFCSSVSRLKEFVASEVSPTLQRLDWRICRISQTALEIEMLKRRYNARLLTDSEGETVEVEIEFCSVSGNAKLLAAFEVPKAYPFSPVNVALDVFEGDVDMDKLSHLLIKNAKPGFGYLSRTCDVIAAHIR